MVPKSIQTRGCILTNEAAKVAPTASSQRKRECVNRYRAEAINNLTCRWLDSGEWSLPSENENTVLVAIRNEARSVFKRYASGLGSGFEEAFHASDEARRIALEELECWRARLKPEDFEVLALRALGMDSCEVATELGIKRSTARVRLMRATQRLELLLEAA